MVRYLDTGATRGFYDRFGAKQDAQAFYEDPALDALVSHLPLGSAARVFEFGCGTGRLAKKLLSDGLSAGAQYGGCDLSETMVGLAKRRVDGFGARVTIWQSGEKPDFAPANGPFDIVLSTYVLDVLWPDAARAVVEEAARNLKKGGSLGLVSLTAGNTFSGRLTSGLWSLLAGVAPALLGGCHPIELSRFLDEKIWRITYNDIITSWTIPSQVLIATRR